MKEARWVSRSISIWNRPDLRSILGTARVRTECRNMELLRLVKCERLRRNEKNGLEARRSFTLPAWVH